MNVNAVSSLTDPYVQSILSSSLNQASSSTGSTVPSSLGLPQDSSPNISPFAQVLSTLQQLQQTNPTEYQQVTSQISTNLQNAANTATANGNTAQASQLNKLAGDFSSASQSNTLPNVQDLAQAIGGAHGHHHHHVHAPSAGSDSTSDPNSSTTSSSSLSQIISAFFSNSAASTQNSALDPLSIINSTLNSATQ
jgi:hypothetical protein